MSTVNFFDFWNTDDDILVRIPKAVLRQTFAGLNTKKAIDLYSRFGDTNPQARKESLKIHWSGEPNHRDPSSFDISLIMEEDNPKERVIAFPLFLVDAYYFNYWDAYRRQRPYNQNKQAFCAFMVNNPGCEVRNRMFIRMSQYKPVHSMGVVFKNVNFHVPKFSEIAESLELINQFKFMICFENTSKPYYITEKLQNAWIGGTIPIYWGCTNVQKWLNPKAFLYLRDESEEAMRELIERVKELDNDHAKYMEMYNQPLLIGDIPDVFNIDVIRAKMNCILENEAKNDS